MEIIKIIFYSVAIVSLLFANLMLLAIWRAILAKTDSSIRLNMTNSILTKTMEKYGSKLDLNTNVNDGLKKELKSLNNELRKTDG